MRKVKAHGLLERVGIGYHKTSRVTGKSGPKLRSFISSTSASAIR